MLWRRSDGAVTEAEARAVLRAYVTVGGIERWLAEQWWEPVAGGWRGRLGSWSFRVEPTPGGVRVVMYGTGGEPTAWIVPAV